MFKDLGFRFLTGLIVQQDRRHPAVKIGFRDSWKILWPYIKENFTDQLKSVWFIIFYLAFFQIIVLGLPIVYATMIGAGILIVTLGLMFFMEGLRLGLMPLGESIGAILPRNSALPIILLFAFLLGIGATFAEPAISVLRAAGGRVQPDQAPLLYSLLNDFTDQLVISVGIGVGFAVLLGVLRFFYGWSLKVLIIPLVTILASLTIWMNYDPIMQPILGLAWDCGAVTTGPVTVPLVLALGIGVCRIVGDGSANNAGFGIVTLASLFPIIAVLSLGIYHYSAEDYYGQPAYEGEILIAPSSEDPAIENSEKNNLVEKREEFSPKEFDEITTQGLIDTKKYNVFFTDGQPYLDELGRIILENPTITIEKKPEPRPHVMTSNQWDPTKSILPQIQEALVSSLQAIVPLCLFLFITLRLIMPMSELNNFSEILLGVAFAVVGMSLFMLGISFGLTPLGEQLGSNVPASFASIVPWGMNGLEGPLFTSDLVGKLVAVGFGFFLGYGATLAEPALNALGDTVEKITVGAFRKRLLMQSVAIGVGIGIAAGVCKIAYNIPLAYLLIPPYLGLLVLTMISTEEFVNFGWDSAGVTTGPITVPLVLAMGLGIGANIPGVIDGFGVLALASVGPIISVLTVGLIVSRARKKQDDSFNLEMEGAE